MKRVISDEHSRDVVRDGPLHGKPAAKKRKIVVPLKSSVPTMVAPAAKAPAPQRMEPDGVVHAAEGRLTQGLSPTAMWLAYLDWSSHLANAPFRRMALAEAAQQQMGRWMQTLSGQQVIVAGPHDHRFDSAAWKQLPFSTLQQGFLLLEEWWARAAAPAEGVNRHNASIVSFAARQWLDTFSPSNFPCFNPDVIAATLQQSGGNLVTGMRAFFDDWQRAVGDRPPGNAPLQVGRDLAVTPGKVVFRNELIELIQYTPSTGTVRPEPVLIVPAWIMKYYILDLSPGNSLIRYLVGQGYSVFAISWRSEDQLAFLEDMMEAQGYLDSRQMAGTFQMLRSNDLIWSRMIRNYLLGRPDATSDLMTWNADGTRMPARMHSQYLRWMYLENRLAEGRFEVDGRPIAVADIKLPMFVVGTETDHVAPWHSVYKIHLLSDGETTFVLTSGGHNAGIVSEPGHPHRHFRIGRRPADGNYIGPDEWMAATPSQEGSWWPRWVDWLGQRSGAPIAPPPGGNRKAGYPVLMDAPGSYVLEH